MNAYIRLSRQVEMFKNPRISHNCIEYRMSVPRDKQEFICDRCDVRKPRVEFEAYDDPDRTYCWCRKCRLENPIPVPDCEVRCRIRATTNLPADFPIPQSLVEVVRLKVQLGRLLKEREKYEDHQRRSGVAIG